jgi:hypothetical protein
MSQKSYKEELHIDLHRLEREWVEQPRLYHKYAEALADARLDLDRAKEQLDIKKANLDLEIRMDPAAWGLEKVTEAAINNTIILDENYTKLRSAVHQANHTVEVLFGAVRAFDHRKAALENLVRLHGQQYFSSPTTVNATPETREDIDKAERSDVATRQRRRLNPPASE